MYDKGGESIMSTETHEEMGQNIRIIELLIKGAATGGFTVLAGIMAARHLAGIYIDLPTAVAMEATGAAICSVIGGMAASMRIV